MNANIRVGLQRRPTVLGDIYDYGLSVMADKIFQHVRNQGHTLFVHVDRGTETVYAHRGDYWPNIRCELIGTYDARVIPSVIREDLTEFVREQAARKNAEKKTKRETREEAV